MPLLPRRSLLRWILTAVAALAVIYLLLLIPDPEPSLPALQSSLTARAFLWNQDARWDSLEARFAAARSAGCDAVRPQLERAERGLGELLARIETDCLPPGDSAFARLEEGFFTLAPLVGACPSRVPFYVMLGARMRNALKRQSEHWDVTDRLTRVTLYRLLYGGRSAVEEVILQTPDSLRPAALVPGMPEPSVTPASDVLGLTIHSGDILVSRGGAPTSALIARGNDFPGNFSHIALAYVDSASGRMSIMESHIERGFAVATPEEYLRDTKLRVMILRLRHDLPALRRDPLLPHRAASAMLARGRVRHIPYDFSMDCADTARFFCSEVASQAYKAFGVQLWMGMSQISSPGLCHWLADLGVRHFETQEPSDLEYDPQLCVVAEWRDAEMLSKDHIDNAVTEAMLEGAERGERLTHRSTDLPLARLLKGYCMVLNALGWVGPIPEGMNATSALKHETYRRRHEASASLVRIAVDAFRRERGYDPPYWELVRMARRALAAARAD